MSHKLDKDVAGDDYTQASGEQHRFEEVDIIKSKSVNSYHIVKPFEDIDEYDDNNQRVLKGAQSVPQLQSPQDLLSRNDSFVMNANSSAYSAFNPQTADQNGRQQPTFTNLVSKAFTDFRVKSEINISDSSNLYKLSPDRSPIVTVPGVYFTRRGSQEQGRAIESCLEKASRVLPSLSAIVPSTINNLSERTVKVIDTLVNELSNKNTGLAAEFSEAKSKVENLQTQVDRLEVALLKTAEIGSDALEFIQIVSNQDPDLLRLFVDKNRDVLDSESDKVNHSL